MLTELIEKRRNEYVKFFVDENGENVARIYGSPVHWYKDGVYEDVDINFYINTTSIPAYYKFITNNNYFRIGLSEDLSVNRAFKFAFRYDGLGELFTTIKGIALYDSSTGQYEIFETPKSNIGTIENNKAKYSEVFSGVDYELQSLPNEVKEYIYINSKSNIPDPTTYGFNPDTTYLIFLNKIETSLDINYSNEKLEVFEEGVRKLTSPKEWAKSASGRELEIINSYDSSTGEYFFGVSYKNLLRASLPITIDPTWTSRNGSSQTFQDVNNYDVAVDYTTQTLTYTETNCVIQDGGSSIYASYSTSTQKGQGEFGKDTLYTTSDRWGFIKLDISSLGITASQVINAKLRFGTNPQPLYSDPVTLKFYEVLNTWNISTSPFSLYSISSSPTSMNMVLDYNNPITNYLDITNVIKSWIDGTKTNNGFKWQKQAGGSGGFVGTLESGNGIYYEIKYGVALTKPTLTGVVNQVQNRFDYTLTHDGVNTARYELRYIKNGGLNVQDYANNPIVDGLDGLPLNNIPVGTTVISSPFIDGRYEYVRYIVAIGIDDVENKSYSDTILLGFPPLAPTNGVIDTSSTATTGSQITFTWTPSVGANNYKIYSADGLTELADSANISGFDKNSPKWVKTGLTNDTAFTIQVKAYNTIGISTSALTITGKSKKNGLLTQSSFELVASQDKSISSNNSTPLINTLVIGDITDYQYNTYLQFSLPSYITADRIASANLSIYSRGEYSGISTDTDTFSIFSVTSDWLQSSVTTWSNKPTHNATVRASAVHNLGVGEKLWDIKSLVQDWLNNTITNNGLLVKGTNIAKAFSAESSESTSSNKPKLKLQLNPLSIPEPTNFRVVNINTTTNKITFAWDYIDSTSKFEIYKSDGTFVTEIPNGARTFDVSFNPVDFQISRYIKAKDDYYDNGGVVYSSPSNTVTLYTSAPDEPTILGAISGQNTTITWSQLEGALGYKVYKVGNVSPIVTINDPTTTSYQILNTETKGEFYVTSFNDIGESGQSNHLKFATLPNSPQPLSISQTANGFLVTWIDNSSIEDGFRLQWRQDKSSWQDLTNIPTGSTSYEHSFVIQDGILYEYQLSAFTNGAVDIIGGGYSGFATWGIQVLDSPTVSGLIDTVNNKFVWTWNDITSAEGYFLTLTDKVLGAGGETTTYEITDNTFEYDLGIGEADCDLIVKAFSNDPPYERFYSSDSNVARVYSAPKNTPVLVSVTEVVNGIKLDWINTSKVENVYRIEKRMNNGSWFLLREVSVDTSTFTDVTTVSDNTLYEYRVCAKNAYGSSDFSTNGYIRNIQEVTDLDFILDDENNIVTYTWTNNPNATGYILDLVRDNVTTQVTTNTNSYSFGFTGELDQSVYLKVYNDDYNVVISNYSNIVRTISSPRNLPINLAWSRDDSEVTFTFNQNSTVEEEFFISYFIGETEYTNSIPSDAVGYTVPLPNFESDLLFRICHRNSIGDSDFAEVLIIHAPKVFDGAYKSATQTVNLAWVDDTINEVSYILEYQLDFVNQTPITIPSTSTNTTGTKYTRQISMTSATNFLGILYPVKNGIKQLPSKTIIIDKTTQTPPASPDTLKVEWIDEGVARFSWINSIVGADSYKFKYTIYHENGSNDPEVIIDIPVTVGVNGETLYHDIVLVTGDSIFGKVQVYTLVDNSNDSEVVYTTYYLVENPIPPSNIAKERTENGIMLSWDTLEYVDTYEVHYSINGVLQPIIKTPDPFVEIPIDYDIADLFEVNITTRYLGGRVSEPSSTFIYSPVHEPQFQIGIIVNQSVIKKNCANGFIYNFIKRTQEMNRIIFTKIKEKNPLEELIFKSGLSIGYDLRTLNYYKNIITGNITGTIFTKVSKKITVNTNSYFKVKINYIPEQKTCQFKHVYDFGDNIIFYVTNKIKTPITILGITGNFGLKKYFTDYMVTYVPFKGEFDYIPIFIFKERRSNPVTTEIHKIIIATLGDSIFAGHPIYWAEAGDGSLLGGSGDPKAQFQYWLDQFLNINGNYEIWNLGKGSNTTTHMLQRIDEDIFSLNPQYVIVNGGTNDLALVTVERGKQGWDNDTYQTKMDETLAKMKENYSAMVDKCLENKAVPIITTLIPRSTANKTVERDALWDFNRWVIEYANSRRSEGVYYVDFYNAGKDKLPPTPIENPLIVGNMNPLYDGNTIFDQFGNIMFAGHGVHPNINGFKIMAEAIPLSIFESKPSLLRVYLNANCINEEVLEVNDIYNSVYKLSMGNLDRGRTRFTTRYIKNIGNQDMMYALYPTEETGVDVKFSINGSPYMDSIGAIIVPNEVHKIDIQISVPRVEEMPEVKLELPMRTIRKEFV